MLFAWVFKCGSCADSTSLWFCAAIGLMSAQLVHSQSPIRGNHRHGVAAAEGDDPCDIHAAEVFGRCCAIPLIRKAGEVVQMVSPNRDAQPHNHVQVI